MTSEAAVNVLQFYLTVGTWLAMTSDIHVHQLATLRQASPAPVVNLINLNFASLLFKISYNMLHYWIIAVKRFHCAIMLYNAVVGLLLYLFQS